MMRKLIHKTGLDWISLSKNGRERNMVSLSKDGRERNTVSLSKEIRFLFQKVRLIIIGFSRFAFKVSTRKSYIS
jgi:hypothetical protein